MFKILSYMLNPDLSEVFVGFVITAIVSIYCVFHYCYEEICRKPDEDIEKSAIGDLPKSST